MIHAEPTVVPLDNLGKICAIRDERGNIAGTGSREVCEVMMYLIKQLGTTNAKEDVKDDAENWRPNIRSAMRI